MNDNPHQNHHQNQNPSHLYTYQHLPPDVWSECLHYLPPEDLSATSRLLPLLGTDPKDPSNKNGDGRDDEYDVNESNSEYEHEYQYQYEHPAEKAAWMAVGSMVATAEGFWAAAERAVSWQEQERGDSDRDGNGDRNSDRNNDRDSDSDRDDQDRDGIVVRTLVANDPSLVGRLLRDGRSSCGRADPTGGANSNADANADSNANRLVRFRDETWQGLYGLLYGMLSEVAEIKTKAETDPNRMADDDSESESEGDDDIDIEIDNETVTETEGGGGNAAVGEEEEEVKGADDKTNNKVYDAEYVALAVGLLLDAPPLPALLLTPRRRQKLQQLAIACHALHNNNNNDKNNNNNSSSSSSSSDATPGTKLQWRLSDARSCQVALRLSNAGLWDVASDIMTARSSFLMPEHGESHKHDDNKNNIKNTNTNNKPESDDDLLAIDGMICSCTFLIDRLYSQTYVRYGKDADELGAAIGIGRRALELAENRYRSFRMDQIREGKYRSPEVPFGRKLGVWWYDQEQFRTNHKQQAQVPQKLQQQQQQQQQPPPPIRSLFANDALRYLHAQLALVKALALVGQHVGLGACDVSDLGVFPQGFSESERNRNPTLQRSAMESLLRAIRAASEFFQEGMALCMSFDKAFEDQWEVIEETDYCLANGDGEAETDVDAEPDSGSSRGRQGPPRRSLEFALQLQSYSQFRSELFSLLGAKISALGELKYCLASFGSRIRADRFESDALEATTHMAQAFRVLAERALGDFVENENKKKNKTRNDESNSNGNGNKHHWNESPGPLCRWNEATLGVLVRCAKDLGKVCGFVRAHARMGEVIAVAVDRPERFLEFALVISIYLHGSSHHPTVENIRRLCDEHQALTTTTSATTTTTTTTPHLSCMETKYQRVVEWLIEEYHTNSTRKRDRRMSE